MDELFQILNAAGVRYLLVGGQAMRLYGMPRFSMDWDFFIPPRDADNFQRLNEAIGEQLDDLVEPLGPHGENFIQTFQTSWGVLQFHLGLPGVPKFDEAERVATTRHTEKRTLVRCLSGPHLLSAKEAANRPQDQSDIEFLRELQKIGRLG